MAFQSEVMWHFNRITTLTFRHQFMFSSNCALFLRQIVAFAVDITSVSYRYKFQKISRMDTLHSRHFDCQSRESTGRIWYIIDKVSYFHVDGIIHTHSLACLSRTLNRMEPLLIFIVTPELFLLFQVKMSLVKRVMDPIRLFYPPHLPNGTFHNSPFYTCIYGLVSKVAVKDAMMSLPSVSWASSVSMNFLFLSLRHRSASPMWHFCKFNNKTCSVNMNL